jgi:hypothetical protein
MKKQRRRLGVKTLGDILRLPPSSLNYQFKEIVRKRQRLAVGEDEELVKPLWPLPSVEEEMAFEEETARTEEISQAIKNCASKISQKLITERSYCRKIFLIITLSTADEIRLAEPLRAATNLSTDLADAGHRLLRRAPIDQPISRIKIVAAGLGSGSGVQLTLLSENDQTCEDEAARAKKLEETMVYIRKRFGVKAVVLASLFKAMQQAQFLVYPLGQRKRENVLVTTDQAGRPKRFYRHKNAVRLQHDVYKRPKSHIFISY